MATTAIDPLDAQKLADRAALAATLRTPVAAAKDVTTLPYRALFGAGNTVIRGANALLPQGVNIPFIPPEAFGPGGNPASMTPFSDALPQTGSAGGSWEANAAAAMPRTPPPPVVPAKADAAVPVPAIAAAPAAPSPVAAATSPWSISKTILNADGSAGLTRNYAGANAVAPAAAAAPSMGGGATVAPSTAFTAMPGAGGMALVDPAAAVQTGVDQHVAYTKAILPILMAAAASYGDPRNAGGHLQTLMHAFGNMDLARDNVSGANTINTGIYGTQQAGVHAAGALAATRQQGLNVLAEHATDSVQTGTELTRDPLTGLSIPTPTYGQRPSYPGAMPLPYSAAKAAATKRVVGQEYTDASGNRAVYNADGTYTPVKK